MIRRWRTFDWQLSNPALLRGRRRERCDGRVLGSARLPSDTIIRHRCGRAGMTAIKETGARRRTASAVLGDVVEKAVADILARLRIDAGQLTLAALIQERALAANEIEKLRARIAELAISYPSRAGFEPVLPPGWMRLRGFL